MWSPVVSKLGDFCGFALPIVLALLVCILTSSLPADDVPLHWKLTLEVMVDVAHVYGTLYRTALDSEATSRNLGIYLLACPGLLVPTLFANLVFGTWFGWSLLSYYAMFHFAKQPFGLICLYKARQGERDALGFRLDYWTCMAGAGIPILLWHAGAFEGFSWFNGEDQRLFRLPGFMCGPLWVAYAAVPILWLARNLRRWTAGLGPTNPGKAWIMGAHYFTWYMGMTPHIVRSLAFVNLFHGLASMVLVYHVVQHRYTSWRKERPETMRWRDRLCESLTSSAFRYSVTLIALALVEEFAWEALVYKEYLPDRGYQLPNLTNTQKAVVSSVLMMPQLSHYFLDGFIWKMTCQNPGLKEAFVGTRGGEPKRQD